MRVPAFLLYASDWLGSAELRRLDHRLKGVFIDLLCLAHGSDETGLLRWPLIEIARAIGCRPADLRALAAAGVLRGDDQELTTAYTYTPRSGRREGPTVTLVAAQPGPIWFIGRMVRDAHVRRQRGDGTRFDAPPPTPPPAPALAPASASAPKPSPKAGFGDPKGDGYPSQAISKKEEAVDPDGVGDGPDRAAASASQPELPADWREAAAAAREAAGVEPLDEAALLAAWAKFNDASLNPSERSRQSLPKWREWAANERPAKTSHDGGAPAAPTEADTQKWIEEHGPMSPEERESSSAAKVKALEKLRQAGFGVGRLQ